jgi:cytochrome c556
LCLRLRQLALVVLAGALAACAHEYHPEYHPETYSFVQNVQTARIAPPGDASFALAGAGASCEEGSSSTCWRECFHDSRGESCARLAAMFEKGEGVIRNPTDARRVTQRLATRACELGWCGPAPPPRPRATIGSPGAVIVYGDFNGNVYLGR